MTHSRPLGTGGSTRGSTTATASPNGAASLAVAWVAARFGGLVFSGSLAFSGLALVGLALVGLASPRAVAAESVDAAPVLLTGPVDVPVGVVGHGVEFELFPKREIPAVFAVVRTAQEQLVGTERLRHGSVQTARNVTFGADLEPGRYRVTPCVGFHPHSCTEVAGGGPFQIVSPEVRELVPGHNRRAAQRINVLFVGSGGIDLDRVARRLLTLDGPVRTDTDLLYGPMAIEPLRSNEDKFNFWYLPDELQSELGLVGDAGEIEALEMFGLPNLQVTALYSEPGGLSDARATSFFGEQSVPGAADIGFGGVRVVVPEGEPMLAAPTLAHEWGHGLFDLRDEYVGFDGRPVLHGHPNCAPDLATAQSWWGAELGRVDPFAYEVLQARTDAGLPTDTYDVPLPELVRVGLIRGGCYGAESAEGSYRPSFDSLMNRELPVFGSVNRARVEAVLEQFSGRAVLEDVDDLTLSCTSRDQRYICEGQLRSYVDPPAEGVEVAGRACRFDHDVEPVSISCSGPMVAGSHVTVAIGTGRSRVEVVRLDRTEPLPVASSRPTGPAEAPADLEGGAPADISRSQAVGPRTMTRFWTVLGLTLVVAGTLVLSARASRC